MSIGLFLSCASHAYAVMPSLSMNNNNNSNNIQIVVSGDQNASVSLFYSNSGMYSTFTPVGNIGTTNSNGYLSTFLSTNSYPINYGAAVYVVVNGQQSQTIIWQYNNYNCNNNNYYQNNNYNNCQQNYPYNNYNYNNNPYNNYTYVTPYNTSFQFQPSSVYVARRRTMQYQLSSDVYSTSYYLQSNVSSGIVSATLSGNLLSIYGISAGSYPVVVCRNDDACGTLIVIVE